MPKRDEKGSDIPIPLLLYTTNSERLSESSDLREELYTSYIISMVTSRCAVNIN
jgi:hypothetical protein